MTYSTMPSGVLLDGCTLGITAFLKDAPEVPTMIATLQGLPHVTVSTPKSQQGRPDYRQLTIELWGLDERLAGSATLDLHFARKDDGLRLTRRTALTFNTQKLLRGLWRDRRCGPPGLDGSPNVLGKAGTQDDALAAQNQLADDVVDIARLVLETLAGGRSWAWEKCWIKRAETCRDLLVQDAIADMRLVQRTTLAGAVMRVMDVYRAGTIDAHGVPVARWFPTENGPHAKAYAKRLDVLRLEIACRGRAAVRRLAPDLEAPFEPDAVADMLMRFAHATGEMMDDLETHVRSTIDGPPSILPFLLELAPLITLAAGLRGGQRGPAPQAQSVEHARHALDGLIETGMANADGIPAGHAVRKVLDALVGTGTVVRVAGKCLYYLNPDRTRAATALSGMQVAEEAT